MIIWARQNNYLRKSTQTFIYLRKNHWNNYNKREYHLNICNKSSKYLFFEKKLLNNILSFFVAPRPKAMSKKKFDRTGKTKFFSICFEFF